MFAEKMRESRINGKSAFAEYCQEKSKYIGKLVCFYEGKDRFYYNNRIKEHTNYKIEDIIKYECGGKKGVKYVRKRMIDEGYICPKHDKIKKIFFIDKDYDDSLNDTYYLYQTPYYSIENFYVNIDVFKSILIVKFGINSTEDDFNNCCNDFIKRQDEFHKYIFKVNVWLYYQKKIKGIEFQSSNLKLNNIFDEISINKVSLKKEITNIIKFLENHFEESVKIDTLGELRKAIEYFKKDNKNNLFRGKFELEFLSKIVQSIKKELNNQKYFSKEYGTSKYDINNETLSNLSEFAETPQCLIEFLKEYC